MKDNILKIRRGAFPVPPVISDNNEENRKNVGMEEGGSAASQVSEADGLMDVAQVAERLCASRISVYELIERQ